MSLKWVGWSYWDLYRWGSFPSSLDKVHMVPLCSVTQRETASGPPAWRKASFELVKGEDIHLQAEEGGERALTYVNYLK